MASQPRAHHHRVAALRYVQVYLEICASSNTVDKPALSITGPHDRGVEESPQYQSADTGHLRLQQTATGTPTPAQWTSESRYIIDAMAPGQFCRPTISRGYVSSASSTRESEGPVKTKHPGHWDPQSDSTVAGSRDPMIYFPTPPVGTYSLPDDPTRRRLSDQPSRSQRRATQKQRLAPPSPLAIGTLSPHAVQQPVFHPYSRPANVRR